MLSVRARHTLLDVRWSSRWCNSLSSVPPKPSAAYESLVASGNVTLDASQASITRRFLDKLHTRLDSYILPVFKRQEVPESRKQDEDDQTSQDNTVLVPRGLYLHGGVGTGKSMLLDLFFRGAQVQCKRRVHFNEFMLEVQTRLAQEKKRQLEVYGRQRHLILDESRDVVVQVAHSIADESHLLCFDEFQVTDVADALIMRKLFGVFFARGVVMIATSNTPPEDLYKGGTNREYFMPFLDQLARHTKVVSMNSEMDYRTLCEPVGGEETFLSPLSEVTKHKMDEVYLDLLSLGDDDRENGRCVQDELLRVPVMMRRTLDVRGSAQSGVCRASFSLLCDTEKGAADYKALAECFHTLVLDGVPALSMAQHDQARRFILLVDELYEHKTRLVCSSEVTEPRGIFRFDDDSVRAAFEGANSPSSIEEEKQRINKENAAVGVPTTSSWDAPVGAYGPSQMAGLDVGNLVALKDLKVAFKRAVSRLREMQGEKYLNENRRWRPKRARQLHQVLQVM